jgi:hypothetical protein
MQNESRDVTFLLTAGGGRWSTAWRRRLRKIARKRAVRIAQDLVDWKGFLSNEPQLLESIRRWKRLARNG